VSEIWITFPDPHPGKNNSNKRLTCPWFLNAYRGFLKDNGIVHLKTDNQELHNYTRKLVEKNGLEIINVTDDLYSGYSSDEILSIKTHYEALFLKEGLKITYLSFRLPKDKIITNGLTP
jgi:tRNA (guanine-N7-)-methyltransferase